MTPVGDNYVQLFGEAMRQAFLIWYLPTYARGPVLRRNVLPIKPRGRA